MFPPGSLRAELALEKESSTRLAPHGGLCRFTSRSELYLKLALEKKGPTGDRAKAAHPSKSRPSRAELCADMALEEKSEQNRREVLQQFLFFEVA